MKTKIRKAIDAFKRDKKKTVAGLMAVVCAVGGAVAYKYAPIVKIGANSSTYTYFDVATVQSLSDSIAEITGAKNGGVKKVNAFQSLVVGGAEKELLDALKVQINRDVATRAMIESSPFKGLLNERRKSLGEDRFYKLFVEPAAAGELFAQYYNNKDPKRQVAAEALSLAKSAGLAAAAQKVGVQVQPVGFVRTPQNEQLYQAAKQAGANGVVEHVVDDPNVFYIMQVKETSDKAIVGEAIAIPRTPPGEFLLAEMKSKGVPIKFHVYSYLRMADLEKPGMVFAKGIDANAKKDANAK